MGVGSLSGDIAVRGPFDNLSIQSQGVRFNMFEATFAYTKVPYIFDGPFEVRTDGVYFPSVDIYDHEGHTGKMLGKVLFNGFEDLYIDLTFLMDNMFALNTTAEERLPHLSRQPSLSPIRRREPTARSLCGGRRRRRIGGRKRSWPTQKPQPKRVALPRRKPHVLPMSGRKRNAAARRMRGARLRNGLPPRGRRIGADSSMATLRLRRPRLRTSAVRVQERHPFKAEFPGRLIQGGAHRVWL